MPSRRVAVKAPAILVRENGEDVACELLDVSVEGFRARTAQVSHQAVYRQLVSGKETFAIEIRWVTGVELGGVFL